MHAMPPEKYCELRDRLEELSLEVAPTILSQTRDDGSCPNVTVAPVDASWRMRLNAVSALECCILYTCFVQCVKY